MTPKSIIRRPAGALRYCSLLALLALATARADSWRDLDGLARQWSQLEQQTSALQSDWRERKPLLDLQLSLLRTERNRLREFVDRAQSGSSEIDQLRLSLVEQQRSLEQKQADLAEVLNQTLATLERMLPRLPPPLQTIWQQQIDDLALEASASESQRLQAVVAMLSAAVEFDQRLTIHQATISDGGDGRTKVTQVYLGLAQAWYVSADGQSAGLGRAGPDAWEWTAGDQLPGLDPASIRATLSMLENPALAEPVRLPVRLEQP
ncbi:MAG: DUF3450 family protein [Pseudomonadota bacterium]